jgi:hypothetical protein
MPKADRIGPCQMTSQPVDQTSLSVRLTMPERCPAIGDYCDLFIKQLK